MSFREISPSEIGGNMIDRIVQNGVTDMFSFSIFPPVFNVADIFVCVGCGLLALYVILGEKETESEPETEKKLAGFS